MHHVRFLYGNIYEKLSQRNSTESFFPNTIKRFITINILVYFNGKKTLCDMYKVSKYFVYVYKLWKMNPLAKYKRKCENINIYIRFNVESAYIDLSRKEWKLFSLSKYFYF